MSKIPIEDHPITHALREYGEIETMGERVSWLWAYGPMIGMYILIFLVVAIARRAVHKIPGGISWDRGGENE